VALARISVTIPEEVLRAADTRAAVERRSRSWLVTEAVAAFTDPPPTGDAPPLRPPDPAGSGGGGGEWIATFAAQRAYLDWKGLDPASHRVEPFRQRLAALCAALARHRARYLVVGSAAMLLLGASRSQAGIEVLAHPSPKNWKRVLSALAEEGARLASPALAPGLATVGVAVFGPAPRADVLVSAGGLAYKDLRERGSVVHVEGVEVHVASIGDVVAGGVA
jgi:hypothetical protein